MTVDNGGQAGTNTSWTSTGTIDLTVKGGGGCSCRRVSQTIGTLLVASNGWVNVGSQMLTVTANATIRPAAASSPTAPVTRLARAGSGRVLRRRRWPWGLWGQRSGSGYLLAAATLMAR